MTINESWNSPTDEEIRSTEPELISAEERKARRAMVRMSLIQRLEAEESAFLVRERRIERLEGKQVKIRGLRKHNART